MYHILEVLGPEHELSVIDEHCNALSIVDQILKDLHGTGHYVNTVEYPKYTVGKELQMHVIEFKGNDPFPQPQEAEEVLYDGISTLEELLHSKYHVSLLGTGMHPFIQLADAKVWSHHHKNIYAEYQKIFNFRQHGWLNIQSFQINLPYENDQKGPVLHNLIANLVPYLPAITAASPIYEGKFGELVDNRLYFYKINQKEVPSISGDVVPEYFQSTQEYKDKVIGTYTAEFKKRGLAKFMLDAEWINSRGAIFRFDRDAIEIRCMDEQDCIKSDIALSCYIRAALRGLLDSDSQYQLQPHDLLVQDFNTIIREGRNAPVQHSNGPTAKDVCNYFFKIAIEYATSEEKPYLSFVQKRIEDGNLSELIMRDVKAKANNKDLHDAIAEVYLDIAKCWEKNTPYY